MTTDRYIEHLTLATGHLRRSPRSEVAGEVMARVSPWLSALVDGGKALPLPVSELAHYTALPATYDGSLLVTISGPALTKGPMKGKGPPLVTIGVAKRPRHGDALWPLLTGPVMPPVKRGVQRPAEPWCAVVIHPTIVMHLEASEWLGDLERCVAWAWIERNSKETD